jgi:hypothetical protein
MDAVDRRADEFGRDEIEGRPAETARAFAPNPFLYSTAARITRSMK